MVTFGASFDQNKELVKQATDIVELVGRYCQLRRQGRNFVALCPWHDDTRPSLQVNPERQSFKCWVCDIGGDVFSFVMRMEGVEFPEALRLLADQSGIVLQSDRPAGEQQDKRAMYQAMAWAEQQYHHCLLEDPEAEIARRYLDHRGITQESIEKFRLGYCPNRWDWILRRATADKRNAQQLESIGVVVPGSEGRQPYDRFRGRVLFSIRDAQARPVGIGGRVLPESGNTSPAKYINSPETPLFTKSRLLYGLDIARDAVRKRGAAMVMEGYTDVILAHQFGFSNAVAVLGTALGEQHIKLLKRFTDRVVLVLDGDEAGQRRAKEILDLFIAQNADLRVVVLPDDLDPCDFLIEHGAEAFQDILERRAVDALDHALHVWTAGVDIANDLHAASEVLNRLVGMVAKAPRLADDTTGDFRLREMLMLQRLSTRFRVPEQEIRERMTALRRAEQQKTAARAENLPERRVDSPEPEAPPRPLGVLDAWQRELLEIVVRHPDRLATARAAIAPENLEYAYCRDIYAAMARLADAGQTPSFQRLMVEFDDPAVKSLLVEFDERGAAKQPADPAALLEELIKNFQHRASSRQRPVATGMLREGRLDERQEMDLLRQIVEQERSRHGISALTDEQDHEQG